MENDAHVILLHGALRTARHMAPLAALLRKAGFTVHNVDYPSRRHSIAELADVVHAHTQAAVASARELHCVGYSLGALVARAYIGKYRPANLGRVVHLAPPNHGSEVADRLRRVAAYRWLYGKVAEELCTGRGPLEERIDYPLGILAGDRSLDPLCARWLPGSHDGKVTVQSTRLPGMAAHKVLHASHTFFPTRREVQEETLRFLQCGTFR